MVKAAVLKQQISKFYSQIVSTEDSFYIYERPLTEINVIASFCALNLRIKFWYLLFYNGGFYNEQKLKSVFVFIIFAVLLREIGKVDNIGYKSCLLGVWHFWHEQAFALIDVVL